MAEPTKAQLSAEQRVMVALERFQTAIDAAEAAGLQVGLHPRTEGGRAVLDVSFSLKG